MTTTAPPKQDLPRSTPPPAADQKWPQLPEADAPAEPPSDPWQTLWNPLPELPEGTD